MDSATIRSRFLEFFRSKGHTEVPSSSLVPADDPTLLFTNAGMVQFKRTFLGQEPRPYTRAVSCQKCVRAGGKHNDLEQVGVTTRHGTFFEMLGNFSFGEYFKRGAIEYAWEFVTSPQWLGIHPDALNVTVHYQDDEARSLWREIAGLPDGRIHGLGDQDNFWQMGDTGPCGPCSEIFVDRDWRPGRPAAAPAREEFEALTETGRFTEIWNLVFMQYDRAADGTLSPLPQPSIDTGSGLDRVTAMLQGHGDIFHTDLMLPLIDQVAVLVAKPYPGGPQGDGVSFRALADHARAVTFLLADGVHPSNEGRGFVVRRILRRGVRHAWLLERQKPTLVELVPTVVGIMGGVYPVLREKQSMIASVVRREEENFLGTIAAGLERLEEMRAAGVQRIEGEEAFKLFDTFGFPLDLTQLIAGEWGIDVDVEGFDRAMQQQRERSRAARTIGLDSQGSAAAQTIDTIADARQQFVGYNTLRADTRVLAVSAGQGRAELLLEENPFYAGGGGQVSDTGTVIGDGWRLDVDAVRRDERGRAILSGSLRGDVPAAGASAAAEVDATRRHDIERNHSATHLVHLVLRRALGTHVRQQGSLVEPGRLRFDFSHHQPIEPAQLADIEAEVNELVLGNAETHIEQMGLQQALQRGAMAFFADKYGDVVRVVEIGDSIELCGGTHVRSAGQVGLLRFTSQSGVAAGVRRIEAVTGRAAYQAVRDLGQRIDAIAGTLRAQPDQLERKLESLLSERDKLNARLAEVIKSGGAAAESKRFDAGRVSVYVMPTVAEERSQLGALADEFRGDKRSESMLVMINPAVPNALTVAVTDDLASSGKDANSFVKLVTARYGGRGGGRANFASGSLAVANVEQVVTEEFPALIRDWVEGSSGP